MSGGELFDLVRPVVLVLSAIISTWVLSSARKRFQFYQSILWAGATFFLPLVVLPLYVIVLLFWQRPIIHPLKGRLTIPFLYLTLILSTLALLEYTNERSVEAHLARASFAKVSTDPTTAIREYREVLRLEDSAHNHKLLAVSLMEAGQIMEAITEFRTAELRGEQDDSIHYNLGVLLERINLKGQSTLEFKKFAASETCWQIDYRCDAARQRIEEANRNGEAPGY